jgi:hypothetical protein
MRRSLACSVKNTRVSHHGHTGSPGIPYAMVLTVSFVLSPVIGLVCHRHPRFSRRLDAGVEASGPHDFAVRVSAIRQARHPRPPHPTPYVRDDRETPLREGGTAMDIDLIWAKLEREYFCKQDWTGQISLIEQANLAWASRRIRLRIKPGLSTHGPRLVTDHSLREERRPTMPS